MINHRFNNCISRAIITQNLSLRSLKLNTNQLLTLLFLFTLFYSRAQELSTINGQHSSASLEEVILDIEKQTDYKFYFLDSWTRGITISSSFKNESLNTILQSILKNTTLNYYILTSSKRVILLENTIVYDELPKGFFGNEEVISANSNSKNKTNVPPPTFYNTKKRTKQEYDIAKVGKSDPNNLQKTYLLNGKVINSRTGDPIQDLAIRVEGTNQITVTDATGNYNLELPSGYNILSVRAMGIESTEREIIMFNNGNLDLLMEEGLQQLDEVVVEADAFKNVEEAITGSEQIVSEDSKNIPLVLGERDILQVAKALPGISSAGEGAMGLNVRGGKTDQNLVLLDLSLIHI